MVGFCRDSNEFSDYIKGRGFPDQLRNYLLLKKDFSMGLVWSLYWHKITQEHFNFFHKERNFHTKILPFMSFHLFCNRI
jgi:hypothetical protein